MNEMKYPLFEKIGEPSLLVGRKKDFAKFQKWLDLIPNRASKSRAIIARRKSGKTVFIQRIFNQLWSQNGQVIPFYFSIPETQVWYPNFAMMYYRTFASHYISFLTRDPELVHRLLTMDQIREYAVANALQGMIDDVDTILNDRKNEDFSLVWDTAYRAPERMAAVYKQRILVMIDEFQYLSTNIYMRKDFSGHPVESMPGSYHEVSESKVAPMLAAGSYVGWMRSIMRRYLKGGR